MIMVRMTMWVGIVCPPCPFPFQSFLILPLDLLIDLTRGSSETIDDLSRSRLRIELYSLSRNARSRTQLYVRLRVAELLIRRCVASEHTCTHTYCMLSYLPRAENGMRNLCQIKTVPCVHQESLKLWLITIEFGTILWLYRFLDRVSLARDTALLFPLPAWGCTFLCMGL